MPILNSFPKLNGRNGTIRAAAAAIALALMSLVSTSANAHDSHWRSDWRSAHAQYGPSCRDYRSAHRGWRRSYHRPHYRHTPVRRPVYVESTPYYHAPRYHRRGPGPGALIGAAIGGLVGAQVGSGEGRLAATAAGVVGGLLLGQHVDER